MDFHNSKKTFESMAESVKDADSIKELMSRAGIPINNVTLVLIDSMRRASFDAGREAMREEAITAAYVMPHYIQNAQERDEYGQWLPGSPYDRCRYEVQLAIRALPSKEGE